MKGTEKMYRYIADVKSGKILTNRYVKLAIERFERDLKKSEKEDYLYKFDEDKANNFCAFCECLQQYKDEFKGKPLILEDWEAFIMCNIYGWVNKKTGYRRFRKAFVFVCRKNGKTALMATALLYDLLTTAGAECYCIATKKEQAKICFNFAKEMVKQNPGLSKRLKIYNATNRIVYERTASYVEALASDTDLNGLGSSLAVIDEVSSMRNYDIIKTIASGQGARPEALMLEITSGSDDLTSAGKQEFDRSVKILDKVVEDDSFFCILYCIDEKDDWRNPNIIQKANPNMDVSIKKDWLLKQLEEAKQNPSLESEYRTKNLGQYITNSNAWIRAAVWDKAVSSKLEFDPKKPYFAVGGIDLSKRNDLTCFTICFYQNDHYFLKHHIYFPLNALGEKIKHDNELWRYWLDNKYITGTYGDTIDYSVMYKDIKEECSEYNISEILFDPYNSVGLVQDLQDEYTLIEVNQNLKSLSPFAKSFEEAALKELIVDHNPIMKWCVNNTTVWVDPNGNIKVEKIDERKANKRIDPVITSLMCIGRIRALLDADQIDLRTPEEVGKQTEAFLANLNLFS